MRRFRGSGTLVTLLLLALTAAPSTALAHSAQLASITPKDGATVPVTADGTINVIIRYTAPVQIDGFSTEQTAANSASGTGTNGMTAAAKIHRFSIDVDGDAGPIRVTWSVPQADGHEIDYEANYTVVGPAQPPQAHGIFAWVVDLLSDLFGFN